MASQQQLAMRHGLTAAVGHAPWPHSVTVLWGHSPMRGHAPRPARCHVK